MVLVPVCCPHCEQDQVVKRGKTEQGKERYLCMNGQCPAKTFLLDYSYNGRLSAGKDQIIDMAVDGSGIRDTARVLKISPATVINELKNRAVLKRLNPTEIIVDIQKVGGAELDGMWSYVGGDEKNQAVGEKNNLFL
jgi:transposase-like protein